MNEPQILTADDTPGMATDTPPRVSLAFLAWTFLKVGSTAFGGFMALISVVQNIVVERRKLLSAEEMLDGVSLATLLPGPMAVNVVAYVGYKLRGGIGALVCATAVILPSFLLLLGLTIAYLKWGEMPSVERAFSGFIPAVAAIIVNAAWGMRKKAIGGVPEAIIAVVAAGLLLGIGGFYLTVGVVAAAALVGRLLFYPKDTQEPHPPLLIDGRTQITWAISLSLLGLALILFVIPTPTLDAHPLSHLSTTFSGMSLLLFGGGFVFIPLIQEVVVDGLHWVSTTEFTSAIALGQITPGPILISATFIGYKVYGVLGALVATIAIFLPPALLMVTASSALEHIKHHRGIQAALRGIRAAVIGMIAVAAVAILQTAQWHWLTPAIFVVALFGLIKFKLDVVWIIPLAGLTGLALY